MRRDCEDDADHDADQRDEISYAEGHFIPPSQKVNRIEMREGSRNVWKRAWWDRCYGNIIALLGWCVPLGLRSFVGVLRSWTLASDLPGAVADCCQVSSANPGKSFEQIGGSELGGNFMVLHGRQLAAMRGCKGGRFAATRRYFVSLFVEPWRLPVTNG